MDKDGIQNGISQWKTDRKEDSGHNLHHHPNGPICRIHRSLNLHATRNLRLMRPPLLLTILTGKRRHLRPYFAKMRNPHRQHPLSYWDYYFRNIAQFCRSHCRLSNHGNGNGPGYFRRDSLPRGDCYCGYLRGDCVSFAAFCGNWDYYWVFYSQIDNEKQLPAGERSLVESILVENVLEFS